MKDFVFDQNYGSVVSELLNGKICAAGELGTIISFEYQSVVDKNLKNIGTINKIYNKLLENTKKLAIISDLQWKDITKEYINNKKKGIKYDIIEEPELIETSDDLNDKEEKSVDVMEAFKDIIEVE